MPIQALPATEHPAPRAHAGEPVDLNHSTLQQLLTVPGMTRTWADRILRFRPYRTRLDLLQQGIVPPQVYNRIKDGIVVHREKK